MQICHRMGVNGFPTLSVLDGAYVYDYQGALTVEALTSFVNNKEYLERAKKRPLLHEFTWRENLETGLNTFVK